MPPTNAALLARARVLDAADPLARFRAEFHLPAETIYLDGNSLGLLSRPAERSLQRVLAEWRTLGIRGWTCANPPWVALSESIAGGVADLLGAAADEVCVTASTTGNLHQLLATVFDPAAARRIIVGDELNFASDAHAIASHLRLRGLDPGINYREIRSRDGVTLALEEILAAFTPDVQLAVLPSVLFASGQLLDMATISREARRRGILLGWDCSHSIGAVPHTFDADEIDFAFWCSYKYLNGGPGAVGGLYVNRRHHSLAPGLAGWWGVDPARRFALRHRHEPARDATALHVGTPHLLSLAPLEGSLELFRSAGLGALRKKSLALTTFLIDAIDENFAARECAVVTPREPDARGGHVSIRHADAWRVCQALQAAGVVPDFRPPNLIRLAPAPLYSSFHDCAEAVLRLKAIVDERRFEKFPKTTSVVT